MKEIKIKGRITPFTPKYRSRQVDISELPEEFAVLPAVTRGIFTEAGVIINGRKCMVNGWGYEGCEPSFYAFPVDEPAPPKKPRTSEQLADVVFLEFCKSKDWQGLLGSWEMNGNSFFRARLLMRLKEMRVPKDCDSCGLRFKCFTE